MKVFVLTVEEHAMLMPIIRAGCAADPDGSCKERSKLCGVVGAAQLISAPHDDETGAFLVMLDQAYARHPEVKERVAQRLLGELKHPTAVTELHPETAVAIRLETEEGRSTE